MKYARLTKEQLEEMHKEFSLFLATQQITADEWDAIKKNAPATAEQELDVFCDLVWEKVLAKVTYVDRVENNALYLFYTDRQMMHLIALRVANEMNLRTGTSLQWLVDNYMHDSVSIYKASKPYSEDRLLDIFNLIKEGGEISDGTYYNFFSGVL